MFTLDENVLNVVYCTLLSVYSQLYDIDLRNIILEFISFK